VTVGVFTEQTVAASALNGKVRLSENSTIAPEAPSNCNVCRLFLFDIDGLFILC
jgi:hypothetical protein